MKFTPRQYQGPMIEHELLVPRCGLWAGMGTGKTSCSLHYLDAVQVAEPGPSLVLGPLRVAQSTWPDEAQKWDNLRNIVVQPVVGSPKARLAALKRDASVFTTNYENLPWLVEHFGDRWPFRKVIADEGTRLKGFRLRNGGVRAQALAKVAHKHVRRWVNLTGLAAPNGVVDLWGQSWFLDQGQRLGRTFTGFRDRWFTPVRRGHYFDWIPHDYALDEVKAALRDLCMSVEASDHMKLPPLIENTIYVDLPPAARRAYDNMQKEMYADLEAGGAAEAFNAAEKSMKCLQLANGAVYVDNDDDLDDSRREWRPVHDAKLEALESVLEEAGGAPVLVAYHFQSDRERLLKAFASRGARLLDKDPQTIRDWNAKRIPVLLAHPQSAGHGLNLQDGGNILVYFAQWWALEEYAQMRERLGQTRQAQAGRCDQPVYVHHIVARDTVDELVLERRASKRTVNDLLHQAMKRG